jgi:hypothetical protein
LPLELKLRVLKSSAKLRVYPAACGGGIGSLEAVGGTEALAGWGVDWDAVEVELRVGSVGEFPVFGVASAPPVGREVFAAAAGAVPMSLQARLAETITSKNRVAKNDENGGRFVSETCRLWLVDTRRSCLMLVTQTRASEPGKPEATV